MCQIRTAFHETNGYVQDERYTAGAGMRRSGAFQIITVFDAWMRRSGVCQFCTAYLYLHGRRGREVPFLRTRHKHIPVGSGATSMSLTVRK